MPPCSHRTQLNAAGLDIGRSPRRFVQAVLALLMVCSASENRLDLSRTIAAMVVSIVDIDRFKHSREIELMPVSV